MADPKISTIKKENDDLRSIDQIGKVVRTIRANKFKLTDMYKYTHINVIAKRGAGKSWLIRDILKTLGKEVEDYITIFSPTENMNPFYKKNFNKAKIYHQYDCAIIERLLAEVSIDFRNNRNTKDNIKHRVIVLDDCIGDKKIFKDPIFNNLLFNARHYHITIILAIQYPLGIKPELRSNFDHTFLLHDDFISNQKKMYDHYAGMFRNFNSFREIYQNLTEDHGTMVITNKGVSSSIYEKIHYYKAKKYN